LCSHNLGRQYTQPIVKLNTAAATAFIYTAEMEENTFGSIGLVPPFLVMGITFFG